MPSPQCIDIGVNLTNKSFRNNWRSVVRRSIANGVDTLILTGTSLQGSKECLELAREWYNETGKPNLWATVGVHPHDAKTWKGTASMNEMKMLLQDPFAVAVGECGLDYNRNFSTPEQQRRAFEDQLQIAVELQLPLFCHEREAHRDFMTIVSKIQESYSLSSSLQVPPIVSHCFTGERAEAKEKLEQGHYLGFTGTICMKERGEHLRELLPELPLDRLMVETDAPFMGWKRSPPGEDKSGSRGHNNHNGQGRNRRRQRLQISEPGDCIDVAKQIAQTIGLSHEAVCAATTSTARSFFRIDEKEQALKEKIQCAIDIESNDDIKSERRNRQHGTIKVKQDIVG